eukprot:CAMPEP_0119467646 /NCGR_PEP_ID=MMETSP1344-20130328/1738_1 /TAXON_ID=236787 /ORGANISM="Florenciella parvula, Strain CCMP2471" /LENGTH=79 /DNA_ID=CAMNT_0007500031 /DNA_START=22 /DNA_END=258 /DNA_ORIENTATION=+
MGAASAGLPPRGSGPGTLKRLFLFLLLVSTIDGLAPNFDTFCQNAVGHWASAGSSSSSATVSEVMRSCGGAVQGVRETG